MMSGAGNGPVPYVRIVEQPASKALRFRYECEGRSAGSLPGANSTPDKKTYPTIELMNYAGPYVVIVSCVTKDVPFRPHPHKIVGKDSCDRGVFMTKVLTSDRIVTFTNFGIQCVKKKDIGKALKLREELRVDPFRTGFEHRSKPGSIDLNAVRLCFQVYLLDQQGQKFRVELQPIVSEPIFDKKTVSDLKIYGLSHYATMVHGQTEMILLCAKLSKDAVKVRFFEKENGQVVWEAYGKTKKVYQQRAIEFRTPTYRSQAITEPVEVYVQLTRESDDLHSDPVKFEFLPTVKSNGEHLKRKREEAFGYNQSVPSILRQVQVQVAALRESHSFCGNPSKSGTGSGMMLYPLDGPCAAAATMDCNYCRNESALEPPGTLFPVYNDPKTREDPCNIDMNAFDSEELAVFGVDLSKSLSNSLTISDSIKLEPSGTDLEAATAESAPKMNNNNEIFQPCGLRSLSVNHDTPHVRILEQPASKSSRFRYECEGRSAGSIPGASSRPDKKTYPTIEVVNYTGPFVVIVSCVTKDPPYRPHPHSIVGKEGCNKGVFMTKVLTSDRIVTFANFGIQCAKKKDMEKALTIREQLRVDPFRTGFNHKQTPAKLDMNSVRLCFQVFIEGSEKNKFRTPLEPVVSEPIYDKKAMADLNICTLSHSTAPASGEMEMILIGEKVAKDVQIRFYEERNGQLVWEDYGKYKSAHVYQPIAIILSTPAYLEQDIDENVKVYVQLKRASDGLTGEPVPLQILPSDSDEFEYLKRKRQRKQASGEINFSSEMASNAAGTESSCLYSGVGSNLIDQNSQILEHQGPILSGKEIPNFEFGNENMGNIYGAPGMLYPVQQTQHLTSAKTLPVPIVPEVVHGVFSEEAVDLALRRIEPPGNLMPVHSDIEVMGDKEDPSHIDINQFDSEELAVFGTVLNSNVSYGLSSSEIRLDAQNGFDGDFGGICTGTNLMI